MKRTFWALALVMCMIHTGCQKEPAKIAVEAVMISTYSISLTEGGSSTVSATVFPTNATNKEVFWTTSDPSVATVESGLVNAVSAGKATITVTTEDGGKKATCEVTVKAKVIDVTGVSLDMPTLTLEKGSTGTLTATIAPSDATNKSVIWSSDNEAVATVSEEGVVSALSAGKTIVTVTTVDQGRTATCKVTVTPAIPEAIDLGLSVKWASWNLGATKPEEYGGYYQWAGTEDISDTSIYLDFTNCPYHIGADGKTGWTKYVSSSYPSYWSGEGNPDSIKFLNSEDDAASVNLGVKWRMPRQSEVEELLENCTTEWTTMNGVKGRTFTSTINGNSIFLPAAGFRDGDYIGAEGSYGYYWSSSRVKQYPNEAQRILINPERASIQYIARYLGLSVRAVTD